jgi:hypothetical protein
MTELLGRDEVAERLGISPEAVRSTLRRYGITEQRGYDRAAVEALERPGRGARNDLPFPTEPPAGTVIRVDSGRTFRRDDHHPDFHWRDGVGWYRWREVQGHARRENGQVVEDATA